MSVAVAIDPTSPKATVSVCRVDVTDADVVDMSQYDATEAAMFVYDPTKYPQVPSAPAILYYLSFEKGSVVYGRSQEFAVAADGSFTFNSYIWPREASGSCSVVLRAVADDSSAASVSVTVQAAPAASA